MKKTIFKNILIVIKHQSYHKILLSVNNGKK